MAEIKTKVTDASVDEYINNLKSEQQRKDSLVLVDMMKRATGTAPKMWGTSLIGFGEKRYKSATSGREVDWFIIGFAPRKTNFSIYLTTNIQLYADDLKKLGKHKTGMGCLYVNKLADVDVKVLEKMIKKSAKAN